ncbi:hypothetical protein GGR51DRAFT_525018 [Nemania sp. FL0031]|nr:hypothetical protein GGR51DRAFT_525018 [Nemania sp. FL0031]
MAPSSTEIRGLFQGFPGELTDSAPAFVKSGTPGSFLQFGGLEEAFADDVKLEIPGLGITIQGAETLKSAKPHPDIPDLADVIQFDQPGEASVSQVIGGGSDEWSVAILKSKAATRTGLPWNHETVVLMHFNSDNKVDSLKLYVDTKHIQDHLQALKA